MPKQRLTDRQLASGVTLTDLVHIVITGDTSQSSAGSSYKATIQQVSDAISSIAADDKVKISSADTTTDYLENKLAGGTNITITKQNTGANESLRLDATGFTGNTSGTCITDLFVSNIHSCSPLNINPLDEGNVYFGSSSGVTIDVINKRFGINKSPEYPIDILGTDVQLLLDDTSTIKRLLMSGVSTDLVEYSARANLIGGLGGITMGSIPENAISPGIVPERGTSGDTYIYSSERANGLNIISKEGSGTDDYIRFYVGQDANGTTPDLYIQGSGVTRGFVGVNMDNPQFTLDVAGEVRISGSEQNILTVIGSGDTEPLFKVEGSSGELFSITDSLVGSLFAVNDISGLPILEVFDDDTVHMGSYQAPSLNTTLKSNPGTGLSTLYTLPMSAYTGAWYEYTVSNTGGVRAGSIMSVFSGNTAVLNEYSTTDIGDTSDIELSVSADTTNAYLQVSAATTGWEVKTIVRSI